MSRYERRKFFESLCELRERYADQPADDCVAVISIEDAIAAATADLVANPAPDPQPADETKA